MKLLGINIHKEGAIVNKILKPGWYPFGAFEKPEDGGYVNQKDIIPEEICNIYTTSENGPEISVNAIVGKNGAGKSSLIEIMFRIINNFAIVLLGAEKAKDGQRALKHAYGVYADLHYETGGQQYKIECRNLKVYLYRTFKGKPAQGQYIRKSYDANRELKKFFYTIVTNYSLYAYNSQDYSFEIEGATNKNIKGGEWLSGLFHKNDGYYTPLVLTPYRQDGNLDINKETILANQRILKLAILAELRGKHLIPNYRPYELTIRLSNLNFSKKVNDLDKEIPRNMKDISAEYLINIISSQWLKDLGISKKTITNSVNDKNLFSITTRYLAIKTLKLALSYNDYKKILTKDLQISESESGVRENNISQNIQNLIMKIRKDFSKKGEHNHLTLKIEQTVKFIENYLQDRKFRWNDGQKIKVWELIEEIGNRNYSQIYAYLPPPIFDVHIKFQRMDEVSQSKWDISSRKNLTLPQLSSGERQLLYSLSYVLYHIKNIESIQEDEERVGYEHICLIFDEIELYFHPEYQRTFITRLIEAINWCNIDRSRIKSIQILLVTHSPFVLTDVFNHNILYLNEKGRKVNVNDETFGANYYTLLNKSFFFEKSAVGDFSSEFMREMVCKARNGFRDIRRLLPYTGDRIVKNIIKDLIQDK